MIKNKDSELFPVKEMYEASNIDSNIFEIIINDQVKLAISPSYNNGYYLIEKFIEDTIKSVGPAFEIEKDSKGKQNPKYKKLTAYFNLINGFIDLFDKTKIYSENVNLFFYSCEKLKIQYDYLPNNPDKFLHDLEKTGASIFNDLIENIRTVSKTKDFKKKVSSREYNCSRNYESAKKYIDSLFIKFSRILVIRIDLGFKNNSPENQNQIGLVEAQRHFSNFLNSRRHKVIFSTQIGYIWKMEIGREKGYHFHLIFFYDGSKSQQDYYIADQIGKYWIELTEGLGVFYNCNASKQKYRNCGIGMVSHRDETMRDNLFLALKYLFKKDQYLSEKFKVKTRVYGRGEMPRKRTNLSGRPRKEGVELQVAEIIA